MERLSIGRTVFIIAIVLIYLETLRSTPWY